MSVIGPWQGSYTDGNTAQVHQVLVRIGADGLRLEKDGTHLVTWALGDLKIDDSMRDHLSIGAKGARNAAVLVHDPAMRAALVRAGVIDKSIDVRVLFFVLTVGLILLLAGAYYVVDPLSKGIAQKVPMSLEYKVKDQFAAGFDRDRCKGAAGEAAVEALMARLGATRSPVKFEVRVVNTDVVNAFALPGGLILVNNGLLQKAESPDEVAGVIAHEMEHVTRRHMTARIVRGAMMTGLWQVLIGDFSGLLAVDPSTAYQLANLKFDRDDESQADAGALVTLHRAEISHRGFKTFFERMAKESKTMDVPAILSTHPNDDKRIEMIDASPGAPHPRPALSKAQWESLLALCPKKAKATKP